MMQRIKQEVGKQDGNSITPDRFQTSRHAQSQPGLSLARKANLAKRCAAGMTLIPACSSLLRFWISAASSSSDLGAGATAAPSGGGCAFPLPVGNSNPPPGGFPPGSIRRTGSSSQGDPTSLPSSSIVSG